MPPAIRRLSCALALAIVAVPAARGESPESLLVAIRAVGPEGEGHAAAIAAVGELQRLDSAALLPILRAFQGANPVAANWLSAAFESIADRTRAAGEKLPAGELEAFVTDRGQSPAARQLAFEWLERVDATARARLVSGMIDDPAPEFRRAAVATLVAQAGEMKRSADAIAALKKALDAAVHADQVKSIAESLARHGEKVDAVRHFGFLTEWRLIGPFEHAGGVGFQAVYPPEQVIDLAGSYAGKNGRAAWQSVSTDHEFGIVNIAKSVAPYKGAVMYATAEFPADRDRDAEIRLGTPNSWKLWVNGELLFSREEYHRGMAIDQYRVPVRLKAGANTILLKICQNEQSEDWAQRYEFQLRLCDRSGAGLRSDEPNASAKNAE